MSINLKLHGKHSTPHHTDVLSSDAPPCSVEFTGRQVIENKLLTALGDKGTVAILACKDDLEVMINALRKYKHRRAEGMAHDYQQLLDAAFPPNGELGHGAEPLASANGSQNL